jgi:hypothetical protein
MLIDDTSVFNMQDILCYKLLRYIVRNKKLILYFNVTKIYNLIF